MNWLLKKKKEKDLNKICFDRFLIPNEKIILPIFKGPN